MRESFLGSSEKAYKWRIVCRTRVKVPTGSPFPQLCVLGLPTLTVLSFPVETSLEIINPKLGVPSTWNFRISVGLCCSVAVCLVRTKWDCRLNNKYLGFECTLSKFSCPFGEIRNCISFEIGEGVPAQSGLSSCFRVWLKSYQLFNESVLESWGRIFHFFKLEIDIIKFQGVLIACSSFRSFWISCLTVLICKLCCSFPSYYGNFISFVTSRLLKMSCFHSICSFFLENLNYPMCVWIFMSENLTPVGNSKRW